MKSTKKYILLKIIALLLLSSWTQAQNIQIYDSTYTIDNTKYLAKYEYYISEEDTIYNGEFSLSQQFENREDIYEYLSLEGYFIENRADETWKLKEGSFEPTGDGYYKDYTYSYDVNGHEFMAIGNFIVGEKTGVWELYDWQIRNSKISDTTLTASINFEKGKAKGEFRLSIENNILEGEIGENELTQGTWSFYKVSHSGEKELIKEWIFDENSIVAMHLYRNEEVQKIIIEKPISADLLTENLLLDHKFLEIIDLKAKIYNEQLLKNTRRRIK